MLAAIINMLAAIINMLAAIIKDCSYALVVAALGSDCKAPHLP
jgi:hypothetical protein